MRTVATKITPEQLAGEIQKLLDEYGDQVVDGLTRAGRKTTRETAKAVSASARPRIHGRTGRYAASWTSKFTPSRVGFEGVVYSKEPGLPHLLEHGHAITYLGGVRGKGPGRARAFPHIAEVDEQVPDLLENNIRKEIERL